MEFFVIGERGWLAFGDHDVFLLHCHGQGNCTEGQKESLY
jgi:hypothetical protein